MSYVTRTDMQSYMISGGENWILSEVHNHPHGKLVDNSESLKTKMDNLSGKLGLSPYQKKMDGFPVYYNTNYIRSGQTFCESLSVLDDEVKHLEDLYRLVLSEEALASSLEWIVTRAESEVPIVNDSTSYPSPITISNFGSFWYLLYSLDRLSGSITTEDCAVYTSKNVESGWHSGYVNSEYLTDLMGTVSNEHLYTPTIILPTPTSCTIYCGAYNTSSLEYNDYLKFKSGTVDHNAGKLVFDSSSSSSNITSTVSRVDLGHIQYTKSLRAKYANLIYTLPTSLRDHTYTLPRELRLVKVSNITCLSIDITTGEITNPSIYIEGSTVGTTQGYITNLDMKPISNNRFAMCFSDEVGNIQVRISEDGLNWYIPAGRASGIIVAARTGYSFDFPTLVSAYNGLIMFYQSNVNDGVDSPIWYSYSRDLVNWYSQASEQFTGLNGAFPYIHRTTTNEYYLFYWTAVGIKTMRIYVRARATAQAGGS